MIEFLKFKRNVIYDFDRIFRQQRVSFQQDFTKMAKQLIEENQKSIIDKINNLLNEKEKQIKHINQYEFQRERQNQQRDYIEQQISFTRKEVFITLLMMYTNSIECKLQNKIQQHGFNQINMELIKQGATIQSQEKLKCIHSYFINFYKNFLKTNESENFYKPNENDMEIKQIENQIEMLQRQINQLQIQKQSIEEKRQNQAKGNQINELTQIIEFIRRTELRSYGEIFKEYQNKISQFESHTGRCEDKVNSILVNFADRNVGGLSLDERNIAQEEILMLTHPEAIISMLLFKHPMEDNEAILIKNVIRFNDYDGYESTFRWKDEQYINPYQEKFNIDRTDNRLKQDNLQSEIYEKKLIKNHILCMDAKCYRDWMTQFELINIKRELLKSYVAFSLALYYTKNEVISTGKWGCGIFNGDSHLKFYIQLLAFSKALQNNNRTITFSSFNDLDLQKFIQQEKDYLSRSSQNKIEYLKNRIELKQQQLLGNYRNS
ncbi:unnamed protein product [Paramecium sonneborni]|uniref:PARG catalytic Macro domain-containing protein n=1 Tax=Paramecium sonneborni TaxID=65129 RepID=A0A8S1R352_9CILI|nr:unnamed protein product [Paramecium sonneborni]